MAVQDPLTEQIIGAAGLGGTAGDSVRGGGDGQGEAALGGGAAGQAAVAIHAESCGPCAGAEAESGRGPGGQDAKHRLGHARGPGQWGGFCGMAGPVSEW